MTANSYDYLSGTNMDDSSLNISIAPDAPSVLSRANEFVELHDQVHTSIGLLDSFESFLSTFQDDLSAVSGQISDLQSRSKDIEQRLNHRTKIERPLASLLTDICIPPTMATLILDTDVGEPWLTVIPEFERILDTGSARARVKAARDVAEVAEGLRIVAATKLRVFFLGLLHPIRASVTTNMQVLQTSVLLKYRHLFAFLQARAQSAATEIQRAYAGAARTYYETGFRRYIRALSTIKVRTIEKSELITMASSGSTEHVVDTTRLASAALDGPPVTLAFMSDDKNYKSTPEALFRSLLLVLLDNVSAEYTFVTTFFLPPSPTIPPTPGLGAAPPMSPSPSGNLLTPSTPDMPTSPITPDALTPTPRARAHSISSVTSRAFSLSNGEPSKEEKTALDTYWKSVVEPVLAYTETYVKATLEPAPPAVTLLTMIRLTEDTMAEAATRGCAPLEHVLFGWRLQMWPVFQRIMTEHIDAIRKLAEGSTTGVVGFFGRSVGTTDALVADICRKYIVMFGSMVTLTAQEEETMIFSNLVRLRQEISKLITKHTDKISDPITRATTQSSFYETLLQGLSRETSSHPKAQGEAAWWKEREEEARRQIRRGTR